MTPLWTERVRLAALGWLAVVLTSLSFFPALEDKSYLPKAALMAALLVGLGVALRAARLPGWAVFGIQLIALIELFLLRYGEAFKYGVIPTRDTFVAIDALVRDGFDTAQQFAAPAPANTGLLMMVLFAICLVAVCVDAIALGIGRVPLAGLPLLALYTIPVAALPDGVPFYAFLPGAIAYIAMITSDERDRLAHWGRLVSRNSTQQEPSQIDTSGLHTTGRQVSFLALTIAVILPIFIPAVSSSILDGGPGDGEGDGDGRVLSFDDPLVSLANALHRNEPVDILEVDTGNNTDPLYVRLVALNNPGPDAWTADEVDLGTTNSLSTTLPAPTGLTPEVTTRAGSYTVRLLDGFPEDSNWLPVPFGLSTVSINAPFSYVSPDQTVTAREDDAIDGVTSYSTTFAKPVPTARELQEAGPPPADIMAKYGQIPEGVPDLVRSVAEQVTNNADNQYDQAVDLQAWFRRYGKFTYDLDVGYGTGYGAMADFLTEKVGFCQQYAATMAMMARELGIPSRVVVGLLKPAGQSGSGDSFKFTSDAMHAWPELYFEGVGWVQFEPTPGLAAPYPLYADSDSGNRPTAQPTRPTDSATAPAGRTTDEAPTSAAPDQTSGSSGSGNAGGLLSRGWLILIAIVLLVFLPAGLRNAVRRSRLNRPLDDGEAAEAAWLEVRDHIRDLRLPWTGSITPRAREREIALFLAGDRSGVEALHRLAMAVERARYSASPLRDSDPAGDARTVIASANGAADRTQRLKAFLWPASLMPDIRRGWGRITARLRRRARFSGVWLSEALSSRRDDDASGPPSGS